MVDLETIVVRPRRVPNARLTLVCLGFCGGGTRAYLDWLPLLPEHVELAAICYPGREGRFAEPFAKDWNELAEDTTRAVLHAADLPYVLFGHSMGGWMAFDVASRIAARGGRNPEALVVSSANAPSRGLTPQDMFPAQQDSDDELAKWMHTFGLMPDYVLSDPDLQQMALDLMRADIRVRDTFHYRDGARVGIPLQVLTGSTDEVIESATADQWRAIADGPFRHDVLTGGHFYTPEIWRTLPNRIAALDEARRLYVAGMQPVPVT